MFIKSGSRKIKHNVVWFLADINGFTERKLFIFEDVCSLKTITVLEEKSIESGRVFSQKDSGKKADKIIERERIRLLYTSEDIRIKKGKPYGWTYGDNREIHNRNGEVIAIRQYRRDYYGQKEMINC